MRARALLLVTCLGTTGLPPSVAVAEGFLDRHSEGWFWYEDPPAEEEAPEEEPKPEPAPAPKVEAPEPEEVPMAERPFGTAWIKAEIEKATRAAIDNPTDENIERYILLNRMARAKGNRFAERVREFAAKDPTLDGIDMVEANAARQDRREYAQDQRAAVLKELSKDIGLFFVHEQGPFARLQSRTMERMKALYGTEVLEVSTAGAISRHLDFKRADFQAAFSLEGEGPWILAVHKPTEAVELIADGPQSMSQMEKTFVYSASAHGWLEPERMRAALGMNDPIDPLLKHADRINRGAAPGATESSEDPVEALLNAREDQMDYPGSLQ